MSKSEKYLEALKKIKDWTTARDWAIKVGKLYPDILKEADKQAKKQKIPSDGITQLAARIGANVINGAYKGQVDSQYYDDGRKKQKKYKYLAKSKLSPSTQRSSEKNLRSELVKERQKNLNPHKQSRIDSFYKIAKDLKTSVGLNFEVDHAVPRKNGGKENPDNMQILTKAHNTHKGTSKWSRFKIHEQIEYIKAVIKVESILAKKRNTKIDNAFIERIIKDIENTFDENID